MSSPVYAAATARADKQLEPDGSIQTHSGTVVSGPSAAGAAAYSSAVARADKLLQPDGSVVTSGSGSGGSTPPGGATGQIQYNSAGVFAGTANITTDGTSLTFTVANAQLIGNIAGSNISFGGSTLQISGASFINYKIGAYVNMYMNGGVSGGGVGIGVPSGAPVVAANGANLDIGSAAAVSGTNRNSAQQNFTASFYTGSASAQDYWSIKNVIGTGTTPTATLTIGHSGSSGVASIQFPLATVPVFANNAAAIAGGLTAGCHYRTGADPDVLCIVH